MMNNQQCLRLLMDQLTERLELMAKLKTTLDNRDHAGMGTALVELLVSLAIEWRLIALMRTAFVVMSLLQLNQIGMMPITASNQGCQPR